MKFHPLLFVFTFLLVACDPKEQDPDARTEADSPDAPASSAPMTPEEQESTEGSPIESLWIQDNYSDHISMGNSERTQSRIRIEAGKVVSQIITWDSEANPPLFASTSEAVVEKHLKGKHGGVIVTGPWKGESLEFLYPDLESADPGNLPDPKKWAVKAPRSQKGSLLTYRWGKGGRVQIREFYLGHWVIGPDTFTS